MGILIYGSRTFGRVIRVLVQECGHEFAGFIDDMNTGPDVVGPFDAAMVAHPPSTCEVVNAIGYRDLAARETVTARIRDAGYQMPHLVHPHAYVGHDSTVGEGTYVMAGALVDCYVTLGAQAVVWPGAAISHDCVIGRNTFLSPNCTICGCCRVGDGCFVGAGAVVVDHVHVPDGTRIKAAGLYARGLTT